MFNEEYRAKIHCQCHCCMNCNNCNETIDIVCRSKWFIWLCDCRSLWLKLLLRWECLTQRLLNTVNIITSGSIRWSAIVCFHTRIHTHIYFAQLAASAYCVRRLRFYFKQQFIIHSFELSNSRNQLKQVHHLFELTFNRFQVNLKKKEEQ